MEPIEASFQGTLRIILILLAVWMVLRWIARRTSAANRTQQPHQDRPRGEVRVEQTNNAAGSGSDLQQRAVDADFEEVK